MNCQLVLFFLQNFDENDRYGSLSVSNARKGRHKGFSEFKSSCLKHKIPLCMKPKETRRKPKGKWKETRRKLRGGVANHENITG